MEFNSKFSTVISERIVISASCNVNADYKTWMYIVHNLSLEQLCFRLCKQNRNSNKRCATSLNDTMPLVFLFILYPYMRECFNMRLHAKPKSVSVNQRKCAHFHFKILVYNFRISVYIYFWFPLNDKVLHFAKISRGLCQVMLQSQTYIHINSVEEKKQTDRQ